MLATVFLIVALVLFILSATTLVTAKIDLTAAGLAFWVASILIGRF